MVDVIDIRVDFLRNALAVSVSIGEGSQQLSSPFPWWAIRGCYIIIAETATFTKYLNMRRDHD
jgi:hypothetical protein